MILDRLRARLRLPWSAARPSDEQQVPGWQIERHAALDSTQERARKRPAWTAVIAGAQRGGRGQKERVFVSDSGGLYLTAVLPYDGNTRRWHGFALAVGWAMRALLRQAGAQDVRLRWPNDLMIGDRKVGGILVEQASPETLLVGIGLNVTNQPWAEEEELRDTACRLADHLKQLPTMPQLEALVLRAVRAAYLYFERKGLTGLVPLLNRTWGEPRVVELQMAFGVVIGEFAGLEPDGSLRVKVGAATLVIGSHRVDRLREIRPGNRGQLPGVGPIVDWNQWVAA